MSIRHFLAIELDAPVSAALRDAQEALRADLDGGGLSWVPPEKSHLTVRFLGEMDPRRFEALRVALGPPVGSLPPFSVKIAGAGSFGPRGRPQVLWLGVQDPNGVLAALYHAVDQGLRRLRVNPEQRPYRPHLTLARARGRVPAELLTRLRSVGDIGTLPVDALRLYQSDTGPAGTTYTELMRFPLGTIVQP